MRWIIARLYGRESAGTDALGNREWRETDEGEAMVRRVPFGMERREPQGENAHAQGLLTVATPIPLRRAERARAVELHGRRYKVTGVADTGRMRLLALEAAWVEE